MTTGELADLREHLERYRAVTLQHLDLLSDAELAWRPRPDAYSCAQQLVHVAQTEAYYARGLFADDWDPDRLRLPREAVTGEEIRARFAAVRAATLAHLDALDEAALGRVVAPPGSGVAVTVRSWLWFVLEHEIHHKGVLAEYLRALGRVPPFFAMALPPGARPDVDARERLGGV